MQLPILLTPISPIASLTQDKQAEVLTPCTRQCDRFVDPTGKPLQSGTIIVCEDLPFFVSSNGKIYNLQLKLSIVQVLSLIY